jgi:nitrous oxide reductase accessory protein NosL
MVMSNTQTSRNVAIGCVAAVALLIIGCGTAAGGPPEIIVDRTACDHCLMLISDPAYSAAFQIDERIRVFDDIGCLLVELAEEANRDEAQVWVHDVGDGSWLAAADAIFVRSSQISTPMASGIVAVGDRSAATELASRRDGEIFDSLEDLLTQVTEAEVLHPTTKDGAHDQ